MLMKALDLLRTLLWYIVNFIFSLIDSIFEILKEINALDIVDSISKEGVFRNFYTGIVAIGITLLALFAIWNFIKLIVDSDEKINTSLIIKEIVKCAILIIMSTFMFVQVSLFSVKLSGYASEVFTTKNETLGRSMLSQYIEFNERYKIDEKFANEDFIKQVKNGNFNSDKMYNDKFVTKDKVIVSDEKEYKYNINWIMSIIVGGFFLYALFFSGMMLARRQIEFLFLFSIAPIIIGTSICNKERRSAFYQLLVSLMLQGTVIMIIIGLTALLMKTIQATTFFPKSLGKEVIIKSILYIGCGTFLLTGSQVINRFIGSNVSANSARQELMSMMGFSNAMRTGAIATGVGVAGLGMIGLGASSSAVGRLGGNSITKKTGGAISNLGNKISSGGGRGRTMIGNSISNFGNKLGNKSPSNFGKNLRTHGYRNVGDAIHTMNTYGNIRRYRR